MTKTLEGKTIAILCGTGFEKLELTEPRAALEAAGAKTVLIAPAASPIKAWDMVNWAEEFPVDMALAEAAVHAEKGMFDGLHLPGGPLNADVLRGDAFAVFFIREFFSRRASRSAPCATRLGCWWRPTCYAAAL